MDETGTPDEQPAGFATPDAAPLGPYSTTLTASAHDDAPAPAEYSAPDDPGPALAKVAPTPPVTRDPHVPFEAGQEDQMATAVERDPREPFVNFTPQGAPDFAPPTGAPVTAITGAPVSPRWAPPTGAPVGITSSDPYAQRWASMQAGQTLPPGAYPSSSAAYPTSAQARGSAITAEYRSSDGFGKLWVVLKAVPWPVLLILLAGVVIQQGAWAIWAICIAFLVCSAGAKIAQPMLNRVFAVASAVYVFFWLATLISNATSWGYTVYDAYTVIGRWLCVILMVASPIIVWRAFEKR